jgi:hypothetical protein
MKGVGARRRGIPPLPPSFRLPRRLRGTGRQALFGCHALFSCPLPWRDREEGLRITPAIRPDDRGGWSPSPGTSTLGAGPALAGPAFEDCPAAAGTDRSYVPDRPAIPPVEEPPHQNGGPHAAPGAVPGTRFVVY